MMTNALYSKKITFAKKTFRKCELERPFWLGFYDKLSYTRKKTTKDFPPEQSFCSDILIR